ncbi:hypothetical protein PF008_g20985 [Phytophthora fragariae]|uniref:Uncharacterized protein n=1 Tax=Phytophthora fragariae TaxID=53985 RepID=A0A6G0QXW9_9STRA|nr:hypothetical protein PF008_g20985 [Phytophthora fragariae]
MLAFLSSRSLVSAGGVVFSLVCSAPETRARGLLAFPSSRSLVFAAGGIVLTLVC